MSSRLGLALALLAAVLAASSLQRRQVANPPAVDPAPGLVLAVVEPGAGPWEQRVIDARVQRLPALHVAADEAITPFVPPGRRDLELYLAAGLEVELSDRYVFHGAGSGSLELRLDDESPQRLELTPERSASEPIRLRQGPHRLLLRYLPPAAGTAVLRLWWSGRRFAPRPIAAELLSHDPSAEALQAAAQLRHGRELLLRQHCADCHRELLPDTAPQARPAAPDLRQLGQRLRGDWLVAWLQDPQALRPDASMPRLLHLAAGDPAAAARDLAAALLAEGEPQPAPAGDAARGEALFGSRNCFACHDAGAGDPAQQGYGGRVPLQHVGRKYQPAALAAFLLAPGAHHPGTRMPDVHLEPQEAADLAAWLLEVGNAPLPAVDLALADAGRGHRLLTELGCVACHGGGEAPSLPLDDPQGGCLEAAPASAPRFALDAADRAAIVAVLETQRPSLQRHVPAEYAAETWRSLRCDACHQRDGAASGMQQASALAAELGVAIDDPKRRIPELSQLGARFDPDWVRRLLAGELGERTRPYLEVHMPAFPAYAAALAEGLAREEGFGAEPAPAAAPAAEQVALGRRLSGGGGYQCQVCHAYAGKPALAAFEAPAPNLALAAERLRHDFYHRWMRDPLAIDPQTRMPRFTLPDDPERALRSDVADGSAQAQFEAIWAYLQGGWELQPPD